LLSFVAFSMWNSIGYVFWISIKRSIELVKNCVAAYQQYVFFSSVLRMQIY
jgi:hypothetical protein